VTTNRSAILETLNVLCATFYSYPWELGTSPHGSTEPLHLPALKYLTFTPNIQSISEFRVIGPGLEFLHIVLDGQQFYHPDFGESENQRIVDLRRGTQRELVLSAEY
jgi:hypothetical protein